MREQLTTSFTQEDINQGMIVYNQQAAGSTNDSVLLEATNGLTKVGPVRLLIDIIPILLPLQVRMCVEMSRPSKKEKKCIKSLFS